ncbi:hypothetical protein, partial [Nocardia farcinica]|uniref:hypothetical protein n=1 Tax=Nocardia farcinica TaxID=37329 RepID=UPI001E5E098B
MTSQRRATGTVDAVHRILDVELGSSPVRWCTTSSRDSSSVGQAVKAGVTSSVSSVTLSVGVSVR